jgi:hypothetical protein
VRDIELRWAIAVSVAKARPAGLTDFTQRFPGDESESAMTE